MGQDKYIILKLSDAKILATFIKNNRERAYIQHVERLDAMVTRFDAETGGDIEEIVAFLKGEGTGGFEKNPKYVYAPTKVTLSAAGRRIERLLVRAGYEKKQRVQAGNTNRAGRVLTAEEQLKVIMQKFNCSLYSAIYFTDLREEGVEEELAASIAFKKSPV